MLYVFVVIETNCSIYENHYKYTTIAVISIKRSCLTFSLYRSISRLAENGLGIKSTDA